MTRIPSDSIVWIEGRQAYEAGAPREANPYSAFTRTTSREHRAHDAWDLAWRLASEVEHSANGTWAETTD